ncbi:hypothetical protein [Vibrio sp. EA2]|nr:hypothetical protein [Vibrio sp. EA2]MDV6249696.1 hypothetical protein [Vibrio sp. EA2]
MTTVNLIAIDMDHRVLAGKGELSSDLGRRVYFVNSHLGVHQLSLDMDTI